MTGHAYLILVLYIVLGIYFWQQDRRQEKVVSLRMRRVELSCLLTILALHGYTIFHPLLFSSPLHFGAAEAVSLIAWIALLSYWLASFFIKLHGLEPILFFISSCLITLHVLLPSSPIILATPTPLFKLHFILAMLAYGLMLYAVGLSLLIRLADKELHVLKGKALLHRLPPLLTVEKHLFGSITIGFILLTLALITGFSFPAEPDDQLFYLSHKTVFSLLSWIIFAILLWGRVWRGWRGKTAVNWVLIGFSFLLLGYLGSAFVLHILLGRPDAP